METYREGLIWGQAGGWVRSGFCKGGVTEGWDPGQEAQLSALPRKSEKGILGRREGNRSISSLGRSLPVTVGREGSWGGAEK